MAAAPTFVTPHVGSTPRHWGDPFTPAESDTRELIFTSPACGAVVQFRERWVTRLDQAFEVPTRRVGKPERQPLIARALSQLAARRAGAPWQRRATALAFAGSGGSTDVGAATRGPTRLTDTWATDVWWSRSRRSSSRAPSCVAANTEREQRNESGRNRDHAPGRYGGGAGKFSIILYGFGPDSRPGCRWRPTPNTVLTEASCSGRGT